jgi:hypothetical protein
MTSRALILTLLLVFTSVWSYSQTEGNDERLRRLVKEYGQADVELPFTGTVSLTSLSKEVSISSVAGGKISIRLSPLTVGWFISKRFDYVIIERPGSKGIVTASDLSMAIGWDKYPTYTQFDSIMRSFQNLYPSLCQLDTIGISNNGKLVLVLKISDNPGTDEDEPEVFYSSTIHGDETGGFVLMLHLIDHILKNYNTDQGIKNLVDELEIWINPLANPDGTYPSGNTITNPVRFNAKGYDLNRNFPDPTASTGPRQKETLDMMKFMLERRFVISANFHSGVEVVNYPWDRWLSTKHADDKWFYLISRAYADTAHSYSVPGYMTYLNNGVTRGAVWYVITGGRQDYVTYELQGREVTIELDDDFITPAGNLPLLWEYNYRSLLGYLGNALYGIHGYVKDALSGNPVQAKIFIPGHDKDSSHIYSDPLTGRFARLLDPGSWTFKFSAPGYLDTTIYNIPLSDGMKTDIVVNMVPVINAVDTMNPASPIFYPNPARESVKAVLPENMYGPVDIIIYDQRGMLISENEAEATRGMPLIIDLGGFPSGVFSVIFRSRTSGLSSTGRFIVIR